MSDLIYINVNEEGIAYDQHSDIGDATRVLNEFPNDTIIVCRADSPAAQILLLTEDDDEWKTYPVEVQPALTYTLNFKAKSPAHAIWLADQAPMPSAGEMQLIDGWVYHIDDPETGERLYDSEDEGVPDSLEEALGIEEDADPADIPDCEDHEPVSVPTVGAQDFLGGDGDK